jgi:hypothetical protein
MRCDPFSNRGRQPNLRKERGLLTRQIVSFGCHRPDETSKSGLGKQEGQQDLLAFEWRPKLDSKHYYNYIYRAAPASILMRTPKKLRGYYRKRRGEGFVGMPNCAPASS